MIHFPPIRFSPRPHKQFLWLLIAYHGRLSFGKKVGLDAGCANMKNRPYFHTESYIGMDPNPSLLKEGAEKYPDASVVNCDVLSAPIGLKADFIHCVQVLVNSEFKVSTTLSVIQRLVNMTNVRGVLIFNTSRSTLAYESDIDDILAENFATIKKIRYGNFGIKGGVGPFSIIIAVFFLIFPWFRESTRHDKTYYLCVDRIDVNFPVEV